MVGICIKYFAHNYGGMLQAYSTISIIESRELEYELVQYQKKMTPLIAVKSIPRLFNNVLLNDKYQKYLKRKGKKKNPEFSKQDAIRGKAFDKFNKEHFTKLSPVFVGYEGLCKGARRYNAVITGSDQLWSPAGLPTNYYNLMFVPDDIRKISYASSFGVKNIPWYQKKRTAAFLNRIEFVSMREIRGSEIVKELTGRDVPMILDPVLMFDQAGWEKLVPVKREIEEPYIFAYFLGRNAEHRMVVREVADQLGIKVVALKHLDQYVPSDEEYGDFTPYDVGPERFLNLLRGAEYVCTDSFHGTCFSVIHGKKFVVFNRYEESSKHSKNSRIDSICTALRLEERRFRAGTLREQLTQEIDYDVVYEKLNALRAEANEYLDQALDGIE